MEGALSVFLTLPLLVFSGAVPRADYAAGISPYLPAFPPLWKTAAGILSFLLLCASLFIARSRLSGKLLAFCGFAVFAAAFSDNLELMPAAALLTGLCAAGVLAIGGFRKDSPEREDRSSAMGSRVMGGAAALCPLLLMYHVGGEELRGAMTLILACGGLLVQYFFCRWVWSSTRPGASMRKMTAVWTAMAAALPVSSVLCAGNASSSVMIGIVPPVCAVFLLNRATGGEWRSMLLEHPERVLITTFAGLCFMGTLLLCLPFSAARGGGIDVPDAAFTAVSAVCVTGLTVIDPASSFSFCGQAVLLILIQLGGLGIMSITTMALSIAGRRISAAQERVMNSISGNGSSDLSASLATVFRVTFGIEAAGACILTAAFLFSGKLSPLQSVWNGVFTSVSAFCNAGFMAVSGNLVPFGDSPAVLGAVSALIIAGGLAPSATLVLPRFLAGRRVEPAQALVFLTTLILLAAGFLVFAVFEWNGVLSGFGTGGKLLNAFFQSVTLRTAGFNTVDIGGISFQTFLFSVILMFIGGSPGSTAGGIKTTVAGVLFLAFRSTIFGERRIVFRSRSVSPETVVKASTIALAYALVLLTSVLVLTTTQSIPAERLVFECASALGTVGLSMNATGMLDEIGKTVIMLTMFTGRVGPLTLFMILNEHGKTSRSEYPDAGIPLT